MKDYQNDVSLILRAVGPPSGITSRRVSTSPTASRKYIRSMWPQSARTTTTFYHECDYEKIDAAIEMLQEFRRKFAMVTAQVAKFDGKKHPASTIDHYLNGGTHENLPREG